MAAQVLNEGDDETFPRIGDMVRCHYTCTIASTKVVIESTRAPNRKRPFEFVVGLNQVSRVRRGCSTFQRRRGA